jgi:hypothetical protein
MEKNNISYKGINPKLKKNKYWGWIVGIILSVFNLTNIFTVILGIIGLVGLLNRETISAFTKK